MTLPNVRSIRESTSKRTAVQMMAIVFAVGFLIVGVLGFVPGVTTEYGELTWAGHQSGATLLGIFAVSALHNAVHLAFGISGLVLARTYTGARAYLIGGGTVYLALWLYGILIDRASTANIMPVNNADNWLHLGLAAGMMTLGLLLGRYAIHTGHPQGRM